MTKATAIHLAVLLLCSSVAAAQDSNAPPAAPAAPAEASTDDIQKVVIVSTGSRGSQRTLVNTPVPVDIISNKDLMKAGQNSLDKALGFRVPSFNTVQTPVNDATSLLDPYEIRNMGPSRTLVLINGKRKNTSALVYTQTSPGRGESGADISAIPVDAIKRIDVLRDGASAQYGSDAIAGVVNIILKDSPTEGSFTTRAAITSKHDGKGGGISVNDGISLMGRGFINYTIDWSKVGLAQRSGMVSAGGEAADFGASLADVNSFLAIKPDAGNVNGSPETKAQKYLVNAAYDFDDNMRGYANWAYIKKDVNSFANYRTPYWRDTDFGLLTPSGKPYLGYLPDFIGQLEDYNGTLGVKSEINGWSADVSLTTGGNIQEYTVNNTVNRSLGADSPTRFAVGGAEFTHHVMNADISKQITPKINLSFGTEWRWEEFETVAGEESSWIGGGADSFAGNTPQNSFVSNRRNKGYYLGANFDITDKLLVDAIGRYEKYTDFGNKFVWKASSLYKFSDAVSLRGSLSTGFRAPSLHQIYTQKAQYSFVPGSGIQVSGLVNNVSPEAAIFQVPRLKAETSKNLTVGLGLKPDNNTSLTLDYYRIDMEDRIVLGKEIGKTGDASHPVDVALTNAGIVSASFFINALDSTTSGVDVVFSRRNMGLLGGKMAFNLAANYTIDNERDGDVNNTPFVQAAGQSVLDATQEALIFTSRPKHKTIFGFDLDYSKVNFSLNNTVFGPTTFRQAGLDNNLETKFKTKTVTDFSVNYHFTDKVTLTLNVNNVFDIVPKWEFRARNAAGAAILADTTLNEYGLTPAQVQSNLITFNQRYNIVTYDGSHFSQLGRMYNASLNVRF